MIKNIQGTRLGKAVGHRVVVKSFSGATTKAMKDYLKPNLELSPDQVILHVGTNDLKSKEPQQVADSAVDLARQIENSSDATVIISELVSRRDGFNEAVKQLINNLSSTAGRMDGNLSSIKTSPKRNLRRADYILISKVINSFLGTFR